MRSIETHFLSYKPFFTPTQKWEKADPSLFPQGVFSGLVVVARCSMGLCLLGSIR